MVLGLRNNFSAFGVNEVLLVELYISLLFFPLKLFKRTDPFQSLANYSLLMQFVGKKQIMQLIIRNLLKCSKLIA